MSCELSYIRILVTTQLRVCYVPLCVRAGARHVCQSCDERFYGTRDLRHHVRLVHSANPPRRSPEMKTPGRFHCRQHQQLHSRRGAALPYCAECSQRFTSWQSLRHHALIHTGLLPRSAYLVKLISFSASHWRQRRRGCRGHIPPNILVGGDVNGISPPILLRTFGYSRPLLVALRSLSLKPISFGYKTPPIRFSQACGQSAHKARPPNLELALTPMVMPNSHRPPDPTRQCCLCRVWREFHNC